MKKMCYALLFTGNNPMILARTIFTYESLKKVIKNDIWIITDSESSEKILKKFCKNVYRPKDIEKYQFSGDLVFDKYYKYPNIFMKFSVYELNQFGYTHCILLDSDIIINYDLVGNVSECQWEISELIPGQICCHKYRPQWQPHASERMYVASCVAFNIEENIVDDILKLNIPGKTEEWTLKEYQIKTHQIYELPEGFITNEKTSKKFAIFYHPSGKLWNSALKVTQPDNFQRFKEIENILAECKNSDSKLF